ncbi:MAG: UDP-N-acetylmuramoyl-L-alanine--D-glutamate ligase [Bacillota bacterium]|nr:UDP-N-acetylmuramoyl-L-alanine--D-glutamate ligase [Bacillota bacterium]
MKRRVDVAGKRVAVVGLGVANLPLVRFLQGKGAMVTGCDRKSREELGDRMRQLEEAGCALQLGPGYLSNLAEQELIFLTPGMRKNLPEIERARAAGAVVSSEIRLFFELCRAPVLGITGSSGKTTTTMLSGRILEANGDQVWVGGNIGQPLIEEVERIPPSAKVVLELSSFQLEDLTQSPRLAVVTNVTPNHLDQHASMEEYVEAKKRIFRYQGARDACVFNYDNPVTREMASECPGRAVFFSRQQELGEGAFLRDADFVLRLDGREEQVCRRGEVKLLGAHNVENVLAASLAARLFGAGVEAIREAVTTFTGAPHRLELVREVGGVRYYNDSIATTPARAMAGLASFAAPVVLIAGGYDKKLPFDEFAQAVVDRAKAVVLLGATAALIEQAIRRAAAESNREIPPLIRVGSLAEAVAEAARRAEPGDVVLLSPACASYDMFQNFEERGQRFRELVRGL